MLTILWPERYFFESTSSGPCLRSFGCSGVCFLWRRCRGRGLGRRLVVDFPWPSAFPRSCHPKRHRCQLDYAHCAPPRGCNCTWSWNCSATIFGEPPSRGRRRRNSLCCFCSCVSNFVDFNSSWFRVPWLLNYWGLLLDRSKIYFLL